MERVREGWRENIIEKPYNFSQDRNLHGGLLVGIWNRRARDDDGENAVLHIRNNLLDLFSSLGSTQGEKKGEGELWYHSEQPWFDRTCQTSAL